METFILRSKLTTDERETIITISYAEDEVVQMYTTIPKDYNKALKQGWELVTQYVYEDGTTAGGVFQAPRRCISIRSVKERGVSDKQRENLERARQAKAKEGAE